MKVLIVRVGAMGDVLHALPAVAALRRAQPGWTIDWVVNQPWAALLAGDGPNPIVDALHTVSIKDWKRRPLAPTTLRALLHFRRYRGQYDLVVDMQGTLRSAAIAWLAAGRGRVVGYARPRERLAAGLYGRRVARVGTHVVDQGAALLSAAVGFSLTPAPIRLPLTEWAEDWAANEAVLRRPLAVLAASAGWGAKQWPVEKFGALARQLRDCGFDVVVNAIRKDDPLAQELIGFSGGAARMVVSNVAGLIALLRRADLFVGGDSGPLHLAAALAVPTVALFGPTSPERNGPWGPGRHIVLREPGTLTTYKRSPLVDPGLARLSVEAVMDAVMDAVEELPGLPPTDDL